VAGLVVVVVVLGPLSVRLGQRTGSGRPAAPEQTARVGPAARPPQAFVVEAETGQGEDMGLLPPPLLDSAQEERTLASGAMAGAPAPAPVPKAIPPDQGFEQRLRASEGALRGQLRAIPELRLLSDGEVRNAREDERAAREKLVEWARAKREAALARVNAAMAQFVANQAAPDARLVLGEAQRAYFETDSAYQQALARTAIQRESISHEGDRRLHQVFQRTAAQMGLMLQAGPNSRLAPVTAIQVAKLSKDLRNQGFVSLPGVPSDEAGEAAGAKAREFEVWCDRQRLEGKSGTVPTLTQMLQIEGEAKRLVLVRELTRILGADATTQLAVRAIVDLSPAVRRAAVAGLERRPWPEYAPVLLRGLRYPWPPVADHAAVALRTLRPPEGVAPLVDLLDLPSPSAPVLDDETNRYTVRELVRLNHLRNCLLCHAPSTSKEDGLVRGFVPAPGEPLPVEQYYESQDVHFVRADITYLRQDFSILLPDEEAGPWPHEQRYDFVTRLRTLPPGQGKDLVEPSGTYPQRSAVLYALRGLTGKDGGDSRARWLELLGPMAGTPRAAHERPALEKITISLPGAERSR
jgi:hypothetical protein